MSDFSRDALEGWGGEAAVAFAEPRPVSNLDFQPVLDLQSVAGELVQRLIDLPALTRCVRLDVEDLPCFTIVERQYESWGVRFENAVAIHPSNPAYLPHSGMMVLLAAPKDGWLEARFLQPVRHVSSFVVSSRRTVIRAFNRQNQLVAEAISEANLGEGSLCLQLNSAAQNIDRVTLESFNGQLTVDDFCFCA